MVDMKGKKCKDCGKGTYQETDFHDDMDGTLHCDKCRNRTERYILNTKEQEEQSKYKKETKIKTINKEIEELRNEIKKLEKDKRNL
jgi:hypothetical protein